MDNITVGADLAAKLTGLSTEELKARFQGENGEPLPAEKHGEVFAELVNTRRLERERQVGEDKFKQGIKEKGKTIEAALSPLFQRFQIEADRAEDAIAQLAEKVTDKPGTPDLSTLTAEQLEQLPAYKQALSQREALRKKLEETSSAFDAYKSQQEQTAVRSVLGRHIRQVFQTKNANIGNSTLDDAAEFFLNGLNLSNFKIDDKGSPVPLNADGTPVADEFGNPLPFESFVEKRWIPGFNVADPNKGGGNPPGGKGGGGQYAYTTDEAWRKAIESETDQKKKSELYAARAKWLREKN